MSDLNDKQKARPIRVNSSLVATGLPLAVCAAAVLAIGGVFGSSHPLMNATWPATMLGILSAGIGLLASCLRLQRLAIISAAFATLLGVAGLLLFVLAYGGFGMTITGFGVDTLILLDMAMNVTGPLALLGSAILVLAIAPERSSAQGFAFAIGSGVFFVVCVSVLSPDGGILARDNSFVHRHPLSLEILLILILAASVALHAGHRSVKRFRNNPQLFPALGFMLLLAMSFNAWPHLPGMLAATLFTYALYQLNQARVGMQRLASSENRFKLIAEQAGQLIYDWDIANNRIEIAGAKAIIDPDMPDEIPLEWWIDRLHQDDRQAVIDRLMVAVEQGEPVTLTYRLLDSSNRIRWIEGKGIPVFDENNKVKRLLGTLADITSQRKTREQLQLAANALESTADGVFILDADLKMVTANRAFEHITGFSESDYLRQEWLHSFVDEALRKEYGKIARAAHVHGSWIGETTVPRRNGESLSVQLSFTAIHNDDGMISSYVGVFFDISARIENHALLQHLAAYDHDTGLLNRAAFQRRLELEAGKIRKPGNKRCCWVMHMDIDRFETINDTLGHATGDYLIYQLAARINECINGRGRVARIGGDEFAILLTDISDDRMEAFEVWLELSGMLSEPFEMGDQMLYITVSAGAACLVPEDFEPMDAFRAADIAMYQAKRRGRNQLCFYDETMNVDARENLYMANSLPVALEQGEFELNFQPRYSLVDGEITGMEALIRWNKPGHGMISPAKFIPIAEETGMILPIGWWVIEAAIDAALRIGKTHIGRMRIAINVSARQFAQTDFVAGLVRRVESAGASPHWFEIEITESLLMEKPDFARQQLERLHDTGFTIAIDDFGTGYSSLSYLKHFAVDYLKIDQSFVCGLPDDKDDVAIVDTIIGMSHGLGLKLVAEGIEEKEQALFLQQRGCTEGQGYYFARPMPLNDLLTLLVPAC